MDESKDGMQTAAASPGATFLAAAVSWQHPAWDEGYYPEGLPGPWRLSYFSNEFRAVVVSATVLADLSADEVQRWDEDTSAEFRFFLELRDPATDWAALAELLAPIAPQIGGVILRPPAATPDLATLAPALHRAGELGPVALDLPPGAELGLRGQRLLQELRVNPVWSLDGDPPAWVAGPLAVARCDSRRHAPREWRAEVARCLDLGADNETVLLMLEDDNPEIETLRVTTLIADMLDDTEVGA